MPNLPSPYGDRGNPLLTGETDNPLYGGNGVTLADAWDYNTRVASDYIARQRAEAVRLGLWNPETGMPTAKGLMVAGGEYGNALMMGTTAPGIRAYHGSPHDFDAFSTSGIGTGQGAQTFGHGLYFAENEAVAQGYKRDLAQTISVDGKPILQNNKLVGSTGNRSVDDIIIAYNGDLDKAIASHKAHMEMLTPEQIARGGVDQELAQLEALRGRVESTNTGKMYEVNVRADPEHMLDWDKPLSEQSQFVKDVLAGRGPVPEGPGGKYVADYARSWAARHEAAPGGKYDIGEGEARLLKQAGIPGIRYLDQGSRASGEGSRNMVVFDDRIIDILRKYGIAGLGLGGLGAAASGSQRQSEP